MTDAAHLGALNVVLARLRGLEPTRDFPTGDGILFQPKRRHGKAVNDIFG
jgi:hypothetical protein